MKRIFAWFLAAVMLFGTIMLDVGATAVPIVYEKDEKKNDTEEIDYEATLAQYLTTEFKTAEDKLATMKLMTEKDGFQLYVDELTGEVATKNVASGQILFSNPYDIGATYPSGKAPSDTTKKKLLSQVMVKYTDNDTEKEMWSFEESASRGQIRIKNIKNGLRVEYSLGREQNRMLVPKLIEKERFETKILDVFAAEVNEISREEGKPEIEWRDYQDVMKRQKATTDTGNSLWFNFMQLFAYYEFKSTKTCATTKEKNSLLAALPICNTLEVYQFDKSATQTETIKVENYIKTYIPSYSFEDLEFDHALTEYEGADKDPPLFKLALEYTLDDWGMSVRCPANGIRFNQSLYQMNYFNMIPYMGAAGNYLLGNEKEKFTGYNFFPDGSGTIFRHEDLAGTATTTINAKVYGFDFAYNEVSKSHSQTVRYPVFGIVSNYHDYYDVTENVVVEEAVIDPVTGEVISEAVTEEKTTQERNDETRGFVAVIEEGDALAEIATYHAGSLSKYNSINLQFYPRPKDSYNLQNAISVGANATWTVVSKRKYVGNYKIRYIMLTDQNIAAEKELDKLPGYRNYEPSWMGMASAYRDYLYSTEKLSSLTEKDVKEDIPVYIETLGAIETTERIMSVPVNIMTSLTSFDNIKTMYDEFAAQGVSNIKFKLTGYANGGMFSSMPYKLKWEDVSGGSKGYTDLVSYSTEKGFEVYPDFDFAYVRAGTNTAFDGLTLKKHVVKSINDTYMSKRYYSATKQTMMGRFELAVSPAYYAHFYEKLSENLLKFYKEGQASTISVASLGYALNSDFDEDEPYNREDSKLQTISAMSAIDGSFDRVMSDSGNAYTWSYVDYLLNVPMDSSRYNKSGASVPFLGVVLHGSVQFAGSALNMEGNIGYSLLKAIENGAGLYFTLCFENYNLLKENPILSQYYSVRYDILKSDVVRYYTLLNDLTKDLQLSKITSHQFLIGERVPDEDEAIADAAAAVKALEDAAKAEEEAKKAAEEAALLNGRVYSKDICVENLSKVQAYYTNAVGYEEGNYTVSETGYVNVNIGMKTLLKQAEDIYKKKNEISDDNEKKQAENQLKAAVLANWETINTVFADGIKNGTPSIYTTLLTAYQKEVESYDKQLATTEQRKLEMEEAVKNAVDARIAGIPADLEAYKAAKAALDANTDETKTADLQKAVDDALATVEKYAGSLEKAEEYAELVKACDDAKAALDNWKTEAEAADTEREALNKAYEDAKAAYEAAAAVEKELTDNYTAIVLEGKTATAEEKAKAEAYIAALTAFDEAKAGYEEKIKFLETEVSTAISARDGRTTPGMSEYEEVSKFIEQCEKELEELKKSPDAEYVSAKAALDAFTPDSAAKQAVMDDAKAALDAYIADFEENFKEKAGYKSAAAALEAAEAARDAYQSQLAAEEAVNAAVKAYADPSIVKIDAAKTQNELVAALYATAEYKAAKNKADKAAFDLTTVRNGLLAKMTETAKYKSLLADKEAKQKALEVYSLAYESDEKYIGYKTAAEEAQAAIDKLLGAYKEENEYKTLVSAAEAAGKEFDKAAADFEAKKDLITDADIAAMDAVIIKKANADNALANYTAEKEDAVMSSEEYLTANKALTTANKQKEAFINNFNKELEFAYEDTKNMKASDKPEETDAYKWHAALEAYTTASNLLDYYTGDKALPSTSSLKKADVVYSEIIKTDKDLVAAQTASDNAAKALTDYVNAQTTAAKAAAEYADATQKSTEANALVTSASTDLRAIDSALNTKVANYYSALTSLETNRNKRDTALAIADASEYKASSATVIANSDKVAARYNLAVTEAADAKATADASDAELKTAMSDLDTAYKNIKLQINRITSNISMQNLAVADVIKADADAKFANDYFKNSDFSDLMKKDVAEQQAEVAKLAAEVKALSEKTIASSINALKIVKEAGVLTDTVETSLEKITDPYAPAKEEEKKDDEPEEEDDSYEYTKYTDDSGNIIVVGYDNGVRFIINYNYFDVKLTFEGNEYTVSAYGGIRLEKTGEAKAFTTQFTE